MSAMSNITLRQIEAFLAVAQERKFAAAAERLHVSAPYLSQTIKQLEHALGYTLLTRTTRSVELTPPAACSPGWPNAPSPTSSARSKLRARSLDRPRLTCDWATRSARALTSFRPCCAPSPPSIPIARYRPRNTTSVNLAAGYEITTSKRQSCGPPSAWRACSPSSSPARHASPAYPKDTNSPTENPSLLPTCFPSRSSLPPVARPVARLLDTHRVPLHPSTRRSRGSNLRSRTTPSRKRTRNQRHGDGRRTLLQQARCRFRSDPRPRTLPRRARLVARRHRLRRQPRHRRHPHLQYPARPTLSFDITGIMKRPGAHYAMSNSR